DIRFENDPAAKKPGSDYLSTQTRRLLDVVRERQADADEDRARRAAESDRDAGRPMRTFFFGDGRQLDSMSLSPDGRWLLVVTEPKRDAPRRDTVPYFVSDDGYV